MLYLPVNIWEDVKGWAAFLQTGENTIQSAGFITHI